MTMVHVWRVLALQKKEDQGNCLLITYSLEIWGKKSVTTAQYSITLKER